MHHYGHNARADAVQYSILAVREAIGRLAYEEAVGDDDPS
jgi:hypothetical protein